MEGHREVRRNRPGRRRPDQHGRGPAGQRRHALAQGPGAGAVQRKLDVDRGRRVGLVLHLGLGERRPAVDAPVHGLLALVDRALLDERSQRAHDGGLVAVVHGEVRRVPGAQDAQPLEVVPHQADVLLRVGAARPPDVGDAHLALAAAQLAVHLELDRQPVAVEARHVGRVEAGHRPRLDHEVLEHLVERRAGVDASVGVRRPVVQHEARRAGPPRPNALVQAELLPARHGARLGGPQVGLHRKAGPGQVQGVFPGGHADRSIVVQSARAPARRARSAGFV